MAGSPKGEAKGVSPPPTPEKIVEKRHGRRLIAEDPTWALCPVRDLRDLCTEAVAVNYLGLHAKLPLNRLNAEDRKAVMLRLPTDLPLNVSIPYVPDQIYWERCCKERWEICDVYKYKESWKQMMVERTVEELFESIVPGTTSTKELEKTIKFCEPFLTRVFIKQLQLPEREKQSEHQESKYEDLGRDVVYDHMDVGLYLRKIPRLVEASVTYQITNCGMDFDWDMFRFTNHDCILLSVHLSQMSRLRVFHLCESGVSDTQVEQLVGKLLAHPSLTHLDLSYNVIGDKGCVALARLLLGTCPLETLSLTRNNIGQEGAVALAAAICENTTLKDLDLSLNMVTSAGAISIFKASIKVNSMRNINLAGNRVDKAIVRDMADVIRSCPTLTHLDVSSSHLGEESGEEITYALAHNTTMLSLNIRQCGLGEETEVTVRQLLIRNTEVVTCFL